VSSADSNDGGGEIIRVFGGKGTECRGEVISGDELLLMFQGGGRRMSRVKRFLPVAGLGLGVVMTGAWAGFLGFELFKFVGLFF
jgi:hypothetical protein